MRKGFTLLELIVVLIIITIIAGFAIPSYQKSTQKGREREAYLKLLTIHGASEIYKAKYGKYYDPVGVVDLSVINPALSLDLSSTDLDFDYLSPAGGQSYDSTAAYSDGGTVIFRIKIKSGTVGGSNPCCDDGTCLFFNPPNPC
ncbi:MAG: prepilin-type N-terminal cleavage/methylation domain-containing protein [Candidatus Omnitrophota bacterium]|nr:prepilin-type N-terminal cleavage/methylation domain-containing protein [Candidatus Omnitrophota bacterium]